MIQQKTQIKLEKIIDTFLKGKYTATNDVFKAAFDALKEEVFDDNTMSQLFKLFQIFLSDNLVTYKP
jgi:hypothetical protein